MKFYLLAAFAAIVMIQTASAQCHIGIKGGLNITNVQNDNNTSYDNKLGFHAGLLGHIHLAKHFAIQPEVVFSRQGAQYNTFNTTTRYHLDYVNVPVLFQFMFANGFRLQAGPQVGFLVNARSKNDLLEVNHINDSKTIEVGAAMGMSYVSPIGLGVDARYVHGFTNINENEPFFPVSKNRSFQVGLFYLFGHKS